MLKLSLYTEVIANGFNCFRNLLHKSPRNESFTMKTNTDRTKPYQVSLACTKLHMDKLVKHPPVPVQVLLPLLVCVYQTISET